jgi:hypothetical protein
MSPQAASYYAKNSQIFTKLLMNLTENGPDPNKLMALRVLANMFKNPALEIAAMSLFSNVIKIY